MTHRLRLPIRTKLIGGFGILTLLLVVLGGVAIYEMRGIDHRTTFIGETDLPAVDLIGRIDTAEAIYRSDQVERAVATSAATKREFTRALRTRQADITKLFAAYGPLIVDDADRTTWKTAQAHWVAYENETAKDDLATLNGQASQDLDALEAYLDRWAEADRAVAVADVKTAANEYQTSEYVVIAAILSGLLLAAALAFVISRSIVGGVGTIRRAAQGIAQGDVDQDVQVSSNDEIGDTAAAFSEMVGYLGRMATVADAMADGDLTGTIEPVGDRDRLGTAFSTMTVELRTVVSRISESTALVGAAAQEMASSAEESGRVIGEIALAVGEVAQGAERQAMSAGSAREAADQSDLVAGQAYETAEAGRLSAERASTAMASLTAANGEVAESIAELAAKSDTIGGIVQTMSGIAAQTNLLALNASIEAARAGEHGRGFAVVADEVRELAEEAQRSASSIADLVGQIQTGTDRTVSAVESGADKVAEGVSVVADAGQAFEAIASAVAEVRENVASITSATGEVAAAAEAASGNTEEVAAAIEESSASAQEVGASAQQLASIATELEQLVSRFRV